MSSGDSLFGEVTPGILGLAMPALVHPRPPAPQACSAARHVDTDATAIAVDAILLCPRLLL
jgi:hypothetical protein